MALIGVSVHFLKDIDDSLIGVHKTEQANARKLEVDDHVHDRYGDEREGEGMKPTSMSTAGHSISSQERTQKPEYEQKPIDDVRWMVMQ